MTTEQPTIEQLRWIDWNAKYQAAVDDWTRDQGTIFHSIQWQSALEESFGYQVRYQLLLNEKDNIVATLPLCIGRNLQGRRVGVALPFVHYLNPCGQQGDYQEQALLPLAAQCGKLQQDWRLHYLELRLDSALPEGSRAGLNANNVTFLLPLDGGTEQVQAGASADNRRRTRLAYQSQRFQTSFDIVHLNAFYSIFARRQKQLGTPAPSPAFFQTIVNKLPKAVTLLTVFDRQQKQIVGGMFLLADGATLYYHWGATLVEFNAFHLNHFMYREAINFAIEKGFKIFDLGRSPRNETGGTYRFKAQFGAVARPLYYYRFNEHPQAWGNAQQQMQPLMELWKKTPALLTNRIGHFLISRAMP